MTTKFTKLLVLAFGDEPGLEVSNVAYAELNEQPVAVATAGNTIAAWNLETHQRLIRVTAQDCLDLVQLAIGSDNGKPCAITINKVGQVVTWDLASGEPKVAYTPFDTPRRFQAFTAADNYLLVGRGAGPTHSVYETPSCDGAITVWDITQAKSSHYLSHGGYSDSISVTKHNGRMLAVTGSVHAERPLLDPYTSESYLEVWDLSNGAPIVNPTLTDGASIAFEDSSLTSPMVAAVLDNRISAIMVGHPGLVIWDLLERRQTRKIPCHGIVESIMWTEFEPGVVLVRGKDRIHVGRYWVRVLDLSSGDVIADTSTEFASISDCAIAPNGSVIVCHGNEIQHLRFKEKVPV